MSYIKSTDFATKDSLSPGNPSKIVKGVEIDNEFNAIQVADALNLKKDGSATVSANIPMNSYKFTGLAAGTSNGDSVRYEQLPSSSNILAVASGGTGSGTASGAPFALKGANTDITSLNSPALGSATAVTQSPGDNSTKVATTAYADAATPDASTTVKGKVELADSTEAAAGTDSTRALTPSTLRDGLNASGSAPIYACRAWVNFNGTGTIAIRAAGNVGSLTDNGVGDYSANFTTAMPDANYAGDVMSDNSGGDIYYRRKIVSQTASSIRVSVSGLPGDDSLVCIKVAR